jgi:hypothetical protein
MAFEGVVAYQGKEHITAPQIGRLIAGVCGSVRGILQTQNRIKASMQTANRVRIDTGDVIMDGRLVTNEEPMELNVANGRAGYKRNDLVVLKFTRAVNGIEKFEVEVLSGDAVNTGTPKDPVYTAGDILSGSTSACMPLWRLPVDGITVGEPVCLLPIIAALGSEDGKNFELFAIQDVEVGSTYKNYWHVWRTGNSVTVQFYGWFNGKSKYDAKQCPFLIPEGSRPPVVDGSLYPFDDHEHIYYNQIICPEHPDVLTVLSARPDGKIYVQDMGGALSNAWRMGTLTYTVAH